jgi:RNA 2',3'-cyclic 3'-phosphodiesterase
MVEPPTRAPAAPRLGRVFIALWPPPDVAAQIVRCTAPRVLAQAGRATLAADLHLTLAFLGALSAEQIDAARAALEALHHPRLTLELDRIGCFKRAEVLWIAPSRVPATLTEMHSELWRKLAVAGFEPERRAFKPHLTLARRARPLRARTIEPSIPWSVETLALATSAAGANAPSHYRQLAVRRLVG